MISLISEKFCDIAFCNLSSSGALGKCLEIEKFYGEAIYYSEKVVLFSYKDFIL